FAVDLGGLDQVAGDALEAGHINDHHVADLLPAHQDDQADEAVALVQGQQRLAQVGEHAVEQDLPDVAQQDAADQVGHEVDGAEQVGAPDAPGQGQRDGKGKHVDEDGGHHRKGGREPERMGKGGVLEHLDVVVKPHEGGLGHGGEPLEGKVDAPDEGPDKADDEGQQGG